MEKNIFKKGIDYKLINLNYSCTVFEGKNQIDLKDSFVIKKNDEKELIIIYCRDIIFNVKNNDCYILKLEVEIVRYYVNPEKSKCVDFDFVDKNIDDILAFVPSHVTLMVSQVTGSFRNEPLITPPSFYKDEK